MHRLIRKTLPLRLTPGILIGDISDEMEITVLNSQQKEQSFETFLVDGLWGMAVKILEIPYGTDD